MIAVCVTARPKQVSFVERQQIDGMVHHNPPWFV